MNFEHYHKYSYYIFWGENNTKTLFSSNKWQIYTLLSRQLPLEKEIVILIFRGQGPANDRM